MEKLDISKKNKEDLEDSVMYNQKEIKEVAELLQKGNTNISRKLTRIPFYRLEKIKKIEEEKLKNIHKTEKKKEKDLAKIGKGHDHPQVERRRYKKTKKQKELIQQFLTKEAQNHKEKETNIVLNKENNKNKNINNKIEEDIEKDKKKIKINNNTLNLSETKGRNKINFQNNINTTEHNTSTNNNKINNINNNLPRNYSDYFHDLKYAPSNIKFTRKELRMSKKQQKIQNPEYTLGHFLSKEDKKILTEISHGQKIKPKLKEQKKVNNNEINKNTKINSNNEKSEKVKIMNNKNINNQNIKKNFSDKKINKLKNHKSASNIHEESDEEKIEKNNTSENIKEIKDNNKLIKDEKDIIKEENDIEEEIEIDDKKNNSLKLFRKKRKRMNKYKKAILKFRLKKKKAFYDAIEKNNDQMFFSNTFNVDESMNNVINNVLNQKINGEETLNNNNTNTNYNNNDFYNLSMASESNIQDKSQINNETNSSKFSPILTKKKLENNNSVLYYYSNNNTNNSNYNKDDGYQNNNYSFNNYNMNSNSYNYYFPYVSNENSFNNNNFNNHSALNNTTYNIYNYYQYPYNPYNQYYFQNNINNYYNNNNLQINNNNYSNNNNNNKVENSIMTNSLPLPKNVFNAEFPSIRINFKKENQKDRKLNNYLENLKAENNQLNSINIDSLNGKELISLIKENKNIDKMDLSLVNKLLPEEQANLFEKKYTGLTKIENSNDNNKGSAKKPIREYVDQILDKNFETIFSNFIIKLRDIYYKKKSITPLKAKKRIVVGMREIEKNLKLKNVLLLFIVPYIEKVEGVKNSLDQRILDILDNCRKNEIPVFFGLNKFKLGQISRKKISSVSMLAIINVEGMENELKNIIKIGNELRKKWYLENYEKKDNFKDNKFIKEDDFEAYYNIQLDEKINT